MRSRNTFSLLYILSYEKISLEGCGFLIIEGRQRRISRLKCEYIARDIQGQPGSPLVRVDHQLLPIIALHIENSGKP